MRALRWVMVAMALPLSASRADEALAEVDGSAPMFRLPVYNAKEVGQARLGLDAYVGPEAADKGAKLVMVSFMASFCAPCKKELPYLQSLHQRLSPRGLRVLSVSIDTEPDGQKQIEDLILRNKISFPVLKDRFNLVARRYLGSKSPLPSVFLVRTDGIIVDVHRGYDQELGAMLEAKIEKALGAAK